MSNMDEIKAIVDDSKRPTFDASNIPKFEQFVALQVAGSQPYYFDANRILAKLYSFYPEQSNDTVTAQILLLSLLQFPSTDFLALLSLVPNQTGEPIATIIRYVCIERKNMLVADGYVCDSSCHLTCFRFFLPSFTCSLSSLSDVPSCWIRVALLNSGQTSRLWRVMRQ